MDKVAASGGYMMACVADKIVAAPFSIIGSIGVVAQIPNFNRFLKSKEIDIELHTAGQYKRTLTLLGRTRKKDVRNSVKISMKPITSLKTLCTVCARRLILTGGNRGALVRYAGAGKGLVDEVGTSDDLLLNLMEGRELVGVRFTQRKRLLDRFTNSAAESADRLLLRWMQRGQNRCCKQNARPVPRVLR